MLKMKSSKRFVVDIKNGSSRLISQQPTKGYMKEITTHGVGYCNLALSTCDEEAKNVWLGGVEGVTTK